MVNLTPKRYAISHRFAELKELCSQVSQVCQKQQLEGKVFNV